MWFHNRGGIHSAKNIRVHHPAHCLLCETTHCESIWGSKYSSEFGWWTLSLTHRISHFSFPLTFPKTFLRHSSGQSMGLSLSLSAGFLPNIHPMWSAPPPWLTSHRSRSLENKLVQTIYLERSWEVSQGREGKHGRVCWEGCHCGHLGLSPTGDSWGMM